MTSKSADLERLTQFYGRAIFARVDRRGPLLASPAWFDERLMEWSMSNEAIKVQLFRFVDALPLLKTPASIARHLREYFGEADGHLPGWLKLGLNLIPTTGLLGRTFASVAFSSSERLARKFIAGSNLTEVLTAILGMRRRSLGFTVDVLGEATITEHEAELSQREYIDLISGLSAKVNTWPANDVIDRDDAGPIPRVNVSVKLTSLYSQFDPIDPAGTSREVRARLRPVLREAMKQRAFLNFDMEQYAYKDLTFQIFKEVLDEPEFRDWPDVGIAVQAYLRDCEADLKSLRDWAERRGTPVAVRLVKGAYWDFETIQSRQQNWPCPVWNRKSDTDANYERLTRFLLENRRWLRPALASHNIRSLAHTIALARQLDLPPRSFEIQMLYGMAEPVKDTLVKLGQRVRVYTPFGQLLPGMAYLVRRLLENTANESFLRASFTEHLPEEQLLMNPATQGHNGAAHSSPVPAHGTAKAPATPRYDTPLQVEALTDFHQEDARKAMQAALAQVGGQLGRTYPPIVDDKELATKEAIDSVNPSHRKQVVGKWGSASIEQTKQAIQAASDCVSGVARYGGGQASGLSVRGGQGDPPAPLRAGGVAGLRMRQAVARGRRRCRRDD